MHKPISLEIWVHSVGEIKNYCFKETATWCHKEDRNASREELCTKGTRHGSDSSCTLLCDRIHMAQRSFAFRNHSEANKILLLFLHSKWCFLFQKKFRNWSKKSSDYWKDCNRSREMVDWVPIECRVLFRRRCRVSWVQLTVFFHLFKKNKKQRKRIKQTYFKNYLLSSDVVAYNCETNLGQFSYNLCETVKNILCDHFQRMKIPAISDVRRKFPRGAKA